MRRRPREPTDVTGYRGFFYHFLDMEKGRRYQTVELSAIDTALMMAGVLFAQSYFDRDDPAEREIRDLADKLYRRVEWSWMQPRPPLIAMAWRPESGMHTHDYKGYEEAMILYVLALGSPTHAISPDAWKARIAQLQVGRRSTASSSSTTRRSSSTSTRTSGSTSAASTTPTRARRASTTSRTRGGRPTRSARMPPRIPIGFRGYGENMWGLTACNRADGRQRHGRGTGDPVPHLLGARRQRGDIRDDGTIAPTAAGGSLPFAPGDRGAGAESHAGAARRRACSSATASSTRSTRRFRRQA